MTKKKIEINSNCGFGIDCEIKNTEIIKDDSDSYDNVHIVNESDQMNLACKEITYKQYV